MENSLENDNIQRVSCEDDNTWRIYGDICGEFAIDIYYKNRLKSQTQ